MRENDVEAELFGTGYHFGAVAAGIEPDFFRAALLNLFEQAESHLGRQVDADSVELFHRD